ncbi:hypothetical protein MHU86_13745 [Fragilaria crotonensis]|nr:hypothetical protein MHU86_13745 [Fragilaria crotonensis]
MKSKRSVAASLPFQLRCTLCFGAVLAVLVSWQSFLMSMDQSTLLHAHGVDHPTTLSMYISMSNTQSTNATKSTSIGTVSSNFDFMSHAPEYFTPDFPTHKLIQIQNYKNGHALIVNFHITHHAGTTLCRLARDNGPVPQFACMGGRNFPPRLKRYLSSKFTPWYSNETDNSIEKIRPVYHYVSWEYDLKPLNRSLKDTNWEHPKLVSIIVMRNPMDRLLTDVGRKQHVVNGTSEEWWEYAQTIETNNYALRTITSFEGCCNGSNTPNSYLGSAKTYLQRFTFIIDMDCLDESLTVMSSILGFNNTAKPGMRRPSARERIQNDTLYDYLLRRNAMDIALYQWAKERSLVKCVVNSAI